MWNYKSESTKKRPFQVKTRELTAEIRSGRFAVGVSAVCAPTVQATGRHSLTVLTCPSQRAALGRPNSLACSDLRWERRSQTAIPNSFLTVLRPPVRGMFKQLRRIGKPSLEL